MPKGDGSDCRLIFHLSYPRDGDSVNSCTPQEKCKVHYLDFSKAVQLCLLAGKSCKQAKSDMRSAFRQLCLKIKHFKWLLMRAKSPIDGLWYWFVEKCLPFGRSISCAHFQAFSNAIAWIVKFRTKQDLVNYLDEYYFVALITLMCNGQVEEFLQVCKMVNFPVSLEKTFWATTQLTFLGMLLDSDNQIVALPVDKIQKGRDQLTRVLTKGRKKVTVCKLQQLCRFLNFLGRSVVPGQAFTRRLYGATAHKLGQKPLKAHYHIRITGEMRLDLKIWQQFLESPQVFARPFMDFSRFWTAEELEFFTDASGVIGMGGFCNQEWFSQRWESNFITTVKPSIEYLELFAVAVGVLLWIKNFKNRRIIIFVNNKSVKDMTNHNSSSCRNCMILIRLVVLECMVWNVRLYTKHVRSENNGIAGSLSRMQWNRFKNLTKDRAMNQHSYEIPEVLWPMSKL